MFLVRRCFAPCFTIKKSNCISLECGSKLIAGYTAFIHFVAIFYCTELLRGGRSDDVASPFFQMDKSIKTFATFGIIYCFCFIIFAFLLYLGIKKVNLINLISIDNLINFLQNLLSPTGDPFSLLILDHLYSH